MINKNINIKELFELSSKYINNILKDEDFQIELKESYGGSKNIQFVNNNISYIIYDKNELYNNSYQIKLNIEYKHKNIGYYILYVDENKNFIDEFLVIN